MQNAGAQFNVNQLPTMDDWRALIVLKAEMRTFEAEQLKNRKK
jgi:hypothetical protein